MIAHFFTAKHKRGIGSNKNSSSIMLHCFIFIILFPRNRKTFNNIKKSITKFASFDLLPKMNITFSV